jgi:hypothetical protein
VTKYKKLCHLKNGMGDGVKDKLDVIVASHVSAKATALFAATFLLR